MTRDLTTLEMTFLTAYDSNFADRLKLRRAYTASSSDLNLLGYLRAQR